MLDAAAEPDGRPLAGPGRAQAGARHAVLAHTAWRLATSKRTCIDRAEEAGQFLWSPLHAGAMATYHHARCRTRLGIYRGRNRRYGRTGARPLERDSSSKD